MIIVIVALVAFLLLFFVAFYMLAMVFYFTKIKDRQKRISQFKWPFAIAIVLAAFIIYARTGESNSILVTGYYFFGFLAVGFPVMLIVNFLYLLKLTSKKQSLFLSLFFIFTIYFYGIYNFNKPIHVGSFNIKSDKITEEFKFLHLTDPQFGSLNRNDFKKIRKTIQKVLSGNKIKTILFTGDMVDSELYKQEDLNLLKFDDVDVYFTLGNHELYHDHARLMGYILNLDYKVLRNTNENIKGNINVIGIDDAGRGDTKNQLNKFLTADLMDKEKFNVLLYHRPTEVLIAKERGVDLMLAGHTHGGQIYPYVWLINALNQFPQGLIKIDDFTLFTSDGVGLWGPKMRWGSKNEITIFTLSPK